MILTLLSQFILKVVCFLKSVKSIIFNEKYSFTDKKVLITGGTKGIGLAIAKYIINNESVSDLIVCSRNAENVDSARLSFDKIPTTTKIWGLECDVTDQKQVEIMINKHKPDIIITSAGTNTCKYFKDTTNEDFQKQFDVDCLGVINCVRAALKHMIIKKEGRIVNISSLLTTFPLIGYSAFCAGKGAIGLTLDSIQTEYQKYNINIQHVLAPAVDTDMLRKENTIDDITKIFGDGYDCGSDKFAKYVVKGIKSNQKYITYTKNPIYSASSIIADCANIPTSIYQTVFNCVFIVQSYIICVFYKRYILNKLKR